MWTNSELVLIEYVMDVAARSSCVFVFENVRSGAGRRQDGSRPLVRACVAPVAHRAVPLVANRLRGRFGLFGCRADWQSAIRQTRLSALWVCALSV